MDQLIKTATTTRNAKPCAIEINVAPKNPLPIPIWDLDLCAKKAKN